MMDDTFEDVCSNIRACLISSKSELSVQALLRDYKEMNGAEIPYRKFRYENLEALLAAIPDIRLKRVGSALYVHATPNEKTAHIDKLVQHQKSSKKKSVTKLGRRPFRPPFPNSRGKSYHSTPRSFATTSNRSSGFNSNNKHQFSRGQHSLDRVVPSDSDKNFATTSNKRMSFDSKQNSARRFQPPDRVVPSDNTPRYNFAAASSKSNGFHSEQSIRKPNPCDRWRASDYSSSDDDVIIAEDDISNIRVGEKLPVPRKTQENKISLTNNFKNLIITVKNDKCGSGRLNSNVHNILKSSNSESYSAKIASEEGGASYRPVVTRLMSSSVTELPSDNETVFIEDDTGYESAVHSNSMQPLSLKEGQHVLVRICKVSSPSNFIMQPSEYIEKLEDMTKVMKKYYSSAQKPRVDIGTINVGSLFAIENPQSKIWCRGKVIKVLPELNQVFFECLDYGTFVSVNFHNIYTLMPCFQVLPVLALQAKLANVVPIKDKWQMNDCLYFKELVSEETFWSIIVEAPTDTDNDISVLLYHVTRSTEAVDVGQILIDEGLALDITKVT